jgi:uncharacterized protein (TIGR00725 family)
MNEKSEIPKYIIAVIGTKSFDAFPSVEQLSEEIGEQIALHACWLICGGTTGVMEAAPRGAKRQSGFTIGIVPKAISEINDGNKNTEWPSSSIGVAIFTGLGGGIKGRNQIIINSCDAVIALPGSNREDSGTRSEINFAIQRRTPIVLDEYWKTVNKPIPSSPPLVQYFTDAKDAIEKALETLTHRSWDYPTTVRRH